MSDTPINPDGLLDEAEHVEHIALGVDEAEGIGVESGSFDRAHHALVVVLLLIAATYFVPGMSWGQPWRADEDYVPFWNLIGRELMGQGAKAQELDAEQKKFEDIARREQQEADTEPVEDRVVEAPAPEVDRWPEYTAHKDDAQEVEREIEGAEALDGFYRALARTDLGYEGAITRVGHWGDSVLGNDGITGDLRLRMQRRFGDAGHGFHSLTQYDPSYRHQGVRFSEKEGVKWSRCYIINKCKSDGFYGYGGTTVWSAGGAESRFRTADEGPLGRKFSRFELWYAGEPAGGRVQVKIDGEATVLETEAAEYVDRWERFELEDGEHDISVRAVGGGRVRGYGVVLERKGPGVVWDGMALIGSFTSRLLEQNPEHWARQLQHRELNLVVFTFGGNDMGSGKKKKLDRYEQTYRDLIRLTRKARPEAACLVMAPIDHGQRERGRIVSKPIVAPMVEVQRKVALEEGCAFFDTFTAMGGDGSMGRWYSASPRLTSGDLSHPTRAGHRLIGGMVYRALMRGYVDWRKAKAGQPIGAAKASAAGDPVAPAVESPVAPTGATTTQPAE